MKKRSCLTCGKIRWAKTTTAGLALSKDENARPIVLTPSVPKTTVCKPCLS